MEKATQTLTLTLTLTVAEAAERAGISAHTLRYYEKAGLLEPVDRNTSGHRRYGETDLERLRFLCKMRATGMPIRQLQRFVALARIGPATLPERRTMLETHRCQVLAQIADLSDCLSLIEFKLNHSLCLVAERGGKERNP